jgi:hypothetical protein
MDLSIEAVLALFTVASIPARVIGLVLSKKHMM